MSASALPTYARAAVVIPARNQRAALSACLPAVVTAALCLPVPVTVVVVLDDSDDGSAELAGRYGSDVHFVRVEVRNVGAARAAGFDYARSLCDPDIECWYATTDADSRVEPSWLLHQVSCGADMTLGVVRAADWRHHSPEIVQRHLHAYQSGDDGGHEHIHGANMGFSARAYWRVGGFRALPSGEDVDLVARFEDAGYCIHRDPELSVVKSARGDSRIPQGFSGYLSKLAASAAAESAWPWAG